MNNFLKKKQNFLHFDLFNTQRSNIQYFLFKSEPKFNQMKFDTKEEYGKHTMVYIFQCTGIAEIISKKMFNTTLEKQSKPSVENG